MTNGDLAPAARLRLGPELLSTLLDYLRGEIAGCLGAGLCTAAAEPRLLASSGVAAEFDRLQRELDCGPTTHAAREQEAVSSADLATDERWPELAAAVAARPDGPSPLAARAVAGSWDDEGPIVFTLYLDHEPTATDLRTIEQVEPMLAMSAALVEYCSDEVLRADQLVQMVEHRRIIEQAKGMIMAACRCDAETAFRSLVVASQHFNVKLRDLAVATVELVGDAPAEEAPSELLGAKGTVEPAGNKARHAANRMWAALDSG
ncbi:ANTAR domain-containing protein [Amycolatopsis cihanbeyliensis]|uniref:ANTAR domain-containing protein n=1 Tax=Amycolatopsis cihanbeyliensis TaxID=1128664 RepID=A0A542CUA8_AMYCI|nr:ANTAR domain-containing protein [Amycolatopsis cihanbeyliensis]TQI94416.1 ANTAR domain-containing protein [Amycolatopsis cihanbeyliensis]